MLAELQKQVDRLKEQFKDFHHGYIKEITDLKSGIERLETEVFPYEADE